MDIESQNKAILAELKRNPFGLTGMDMIQKFGAMSYTRRIRDLREAGNHIEGVWEYKYSKDGKVVKKWRRYYFV